MEEVTVHQRLEEIFVKNSSALKILQSGGPNGFGYYIAIGIGALVLFIYGLQWHKVSRKLPPGPRSWPILGSLGLLLNDKLPHHVFWDLSKVYGPILFMRLGSVPTLVVTSPKMVAEILQNHDEIFASRPEGAASEIMGRGKSITFSHGEYWRYTRNIATRELLTKLRIKSFKGVRRVEMVGVLRSLVEASKNGEAFVVCDKIFPYITSTFSQMMLQRKRFFGPGQEELISLTEKQLQERILEAVHLFGVTDIGDYIPFLRNFDFQGYRKRMKQISNDIDDVMDVILEEHKKAAAAAAVQGQDDVQDFVDVLLSLPERKGTQNLHEDIMKILPMEMLVAANDSTNATIEWALLRAIKHPEVQAKIQQELDTVVGKERLVEENDLPNLQYLEATVKEVLRVHPPSPLLLPHKSNAPCTVAGYHIPAKTQLFINVYAIGRDPNVWDKAESFLPERFLEGYPNSTPKEIMGGTLNPQFDYTPFGWGRRSCPGVNLGFLAVRLAVAQILQCFDISSPPHKDVLDMGETYGIAIFKEIPLEVVATTRLPTCLLDTFK
ncbi:unnamed protein product [Calypogeia fissa]